ncbi:pseudouridine synthase [Pleurocapsa sp. PCC 7319]|uniref:pseudouridine synthase n=1 Tax=Pleurocapsa sp. PCC 7319 TaxID=118161 RepID=UPI00034B6632|nr:pseudouridine synthase [Pleurocapsa sp. PCC 7319]
MTERVQKVLSQWGIASRRKAEKMILAGRVLINGQTASLGDKVDLRVDVLHIDDKEIKASNRPQSIYLLLNKPPEVVSTCSDPQNRSTVIDLLPKNLRQGTGIHPVGRLDFSSSGALILTNDGDLTLGLTHPRYHLPKTYLVELDRPPSKKDLTVWRQGVMLDQRKTLPAKIRRVQTNKSTKSTTIEIVLTEGRNRQIRRVAQRLGYQVLKLHRTAIGSITLNSMNKLELPQGNYRHLEQKEINFLKNSFNLKPFKLAAQPGDAVYE